MRMMGIEPMLIAWKAINLPLMYIRNFRIIDKNRLPQYIYIFVKVRFFIFYKPDVTLQAFVSDGN